MLLGQYIVYELVVSRKALNKEVLSIRQKVKYTLEVVMICHKCHSLHFYTFLISTGQIAMHYILLKV